MATQAEQLRITGNHYYNKGRIGAAIDAYTESIALCPDQVACWTNRAQCYRKRREWGRVEEDCRRAILLDSKSIKAHYMLGLALLEQQENDDGIMELEKAFDLARGVNPVIQLVEEIWQILAKAKFANWEKESIEQSRKLQKLKELCVGALDVYYPSITSQFEDLQEEKAPSLEEHLHLLSQVFETAEATNKPSEVPDHLCCKITLDIFLDPVISPSGITYERAIILDHLRKVGRFDPVTREPLEQHQLVPNLALREAVRAFLDEHGWAYSTVDSPTVISE